MTAWIITKDKIASEEDKKENPEGKCNAYAKGLVGPREASEKDVARLEAGEGIPFRLLDDDGEIYYYGRRLEESDASKYYDYYTELAPLDNFGAPNAGCAIQEEKNKDGKWEAIN
ncbi:MAG: hypothetical protein ACXVYB_00225 [Arthrobacter sp.]